MRREEEDKGERENGDGNENCVSKPQKTESKACVTAVTLCTWRQETTCK